MGEFNNYLADTPGYQSLDWHLIKAMLFVETNPEHAAWTDSPMQSANQNDLGYADLMSDPTKTNLIVPASLRVSLSFPNSDAASNIASGVAYLLFRAAHFGQATVVVDQSIKTLTVSKGDSLYTLARDAGTTEAIFHRFNPSVNFHVLHPGTVLKYQEAETGWAITGWESIDPNSIYRLYNANGRNLYGQELNYAYNMIKRNRFLQ